MPYIVIRDGRFEGPWEVAHDGAVIETARAHWDVDQVLEIAEAHAGRPLAWKLIPGGFESFGSADIATKISALGDELADMNADGSSSNDLIQAVDDWFTENGYRTFLYR